MNKKEKADKVLEILKIEFPEVSTPLIHKNAFELLTATMLSAQTLDATTNTVTPELFDRYPNPDKLSQASEEDVRLIIRKINYYKTKSKNLIKMAQTLLEKFDGVVPHTIEELIQLPGVGRKTANVVLNEWFAKQEGKTPEGFVVDTHVKRIAMRLGFAKHNDPEKVEQDLMKIFERDEWDATSLRFIFHGRKTCTSRNPKCGECPLREICPSSKLFL